MLFALLGIFLAVISINSIVFIKQKLWKEFIVYLIIMGISLFYAIDLLEWWHLPETDDLERKVLAPIVKFVFHK